MKLHMCLSYLFVMDMSMLDELFITGITKHVCFPYVFVMNINQPGLRLASVTS